jgi:RNA polymerase sigma-70 factor, ECF subfamily
MNEQQAIQRMKGGDINGLEVLVRTYQVQAVRAVDLITRDTAQAQDIVQAAFVRVFHRIEQFDDSRPFGPWFMQICVNDAYKAVTRNRTVSFETPIGAETEADGTLGDMLPDDGLPPDDQIELNELKADVWEALGKLAPEERAAIVMRYFLNFSEAEMATTLDRPRGTVENSERLEGPWEFTFAID